jgi:hypothetical protein
VSLCRVRDCEKPAQGTAIVCPDCAGHLERALGDVAALTGQLRVTATRRDCVERTGTPEQDPEKERWPVTTRVQGLPFDWDASDLEWVLGNTLTTWARLLLEYRELTLGPRCLSCKHETCEHIRTQEPVDSQPATVAAWLMRQLDTIRHHEHGPECVDEITSLVRSIEHTVDLPRERLFAGPCGAEDEGGTCESELYAVPGVETVTCRACGTEYDLAQRRSFLLAAAENVLAHAELIGQAVTSLGQPVKSDRIRQWAHRGRLVPHGIDHAKRPTYRIGDVLDLLAEDAEREARKAEQQTRSARCA